MTFYQLRALFASLNIAPLPTSDWEEAGGYCLDAPTLLPGGSTQCSYAKQPPLTSIASRSA